MIRRESNQASLADALVRRTGSTNPTFDKIDLTIDWTPVRNLMKHAIGLTARVGLPTRQ